MREIVMRNQCPGCGNRNSFNQKILERDFGPAEEIVAFSHYSVYRCEKCGLIYAGDISEKAELDEYYEKMSKYESSDFCLSELLQKYYQYEVELLSEFIDKDVSILDIGCASGGLLNEFKIAGYDNVYGMEPSRKNCEYAMEHYGITVFPGLLGETDLGDSKYGLVILNSVLEHIMDIRECIRSCKTLMEENGLLFIVVPDVAMFKERTNLYQEFSVEHVNYFGIDTLDRLMCEEGFVNVKHKQDYDFCMGPGGNIITIWQYASGHYDENTMMTSKRDHSWSDSYANLKIYLDQCREFGEAIRERMKAYDLNDGYYVWGTGTYTAMLVQLGILRIEQIKGVFDSNKNYHGLNAYGNIIEDPSELKNKEKYPIVIASQYAFESIRNVIFEMGLENVIINLFENR